MDVQMPDGTIIRNVPEGTTKAQLQAKLARYQQPAEPQPEMQEAAAPTAPEAAYEQPWTDVAARAVSNAPRDVGGVISGLYQAVRHPIQAGKGLLMLGEGAFLNALPDELSQFMVKHSPNPELERQSAGMAGVVGQDYKQGYGSLEGFKERLAEHPAMVLADAATVLTGGGGLLAKTGQLSRIPTIERAGLLATKAGTAVDPLALTVRGAAKVAPAVGRQVANVVGGLGTWTGGKTIQDAARAGYGLNWQGLGAAPMASVGGLLERVGQTHNLPSVVRAGQRVLGAGDAIAGKVAGTKGGEFVGHLRGDLPMDSVLGDARAALQNIRRDRSNAYQQGMGLISKDQTILDFKPIDQALADAAQIRTYKGKSTSPKTAAIQQELDDVIKDWRNSDPAEYHTPEGMDKLKQTLGEIRDSAEQGTPSRVVADRVYNAVKQQIVKQAPTYAKVMDDYEQASTLVKEIERTLSLGPKGRASADTAMRKLQSLTRNNVNTNYGSRISLAKELEKAGAPNLLSNLSAQALNTWTPRGLGRIVSSGAGALGAYTLNPAVIPLLAAQSPRLMGEAALATGRVAGTVARGASAGDRALRRVGINPTILGNYLYQSGGLLTE